MDGSQKRLSGGRTITLSSKEANGLSFRRWERKVTLTELLISRHGGVGKHRTGKGL